MDKTKALKLVVACIICLGLITGIVLFVQWLTS